MRLCRVAGRTPPPLSGDKDTVESEIRVHGGVTAFWKVDGNWVVGFDCAHLGDARDINLIPDEMRGCCDESGGCDMVSLSDKGQGHVWTNDEVESECRVLVDEIERVVAKRR